MNRLPIVLLTGLLAAGCSTSSHAHAHAARAHHAALPGGAHRAVSATAGAPAAAAGRGSSGATSATRAISAQLGDMYVHLSDTAMPAGAVKITAINAGRIEHELVILKTNAPDGKLAPTNGKVSESTSVGELGSIPAGATKARVFTLARGTYQLVCNINGHYMAGMHAVLTVT